MLTTAIYDQMHHKNSYLMTKPQIKKLAENKVIQLGLFDQVNLVEFESSDYPLERLIACRNPLIAEKNKQQREELPQVAEKAILFG